MSPAIERHGSARPSWRSWEPHLPNRRIEGRHRGSMPDQWHWIDYRERTTCSLSAKRPDASRKDANHFSHSSSLITNGRRFEPALLNGDINGMTCCYRKSSYIRILTYTY